VALRGEKLMGARVRRQHVVPKYPGHRMGEWHWQSWGGPLPAAVGLNFVTRSGVGFTNGSQIKPAPDFVRVGFESDPRV
jgi:hypothetical protein